MLPRSMNHVRCFPCLAHENVFPRFSFLLAFDGFGWKIKIVSEKLLEEELITLTYHYFLIVFTWLKNRKNLALDLELISLFKDGSIVKSLKYSEAKFLESHTFRVKQTVVA